MQEKRRIEIFSGGCSVCGEAIQVVDELVCSSCEVEILDITDPDVARRAATLSVRSIPAVVVDGQLAGCCAGRGVSRAALSRGGSRCSLMTPADDDLNIPGRMVQQDAISFLALFTSPGTLLCCALPAAVAAVAGGAAVASLVSTFPWLIPISANKGWIFLVSGLLIVFSGSLVLRPKGVVACSITGGEGCAVAGRLAKMVF